MNTSYLLLGGNIGDRKQNLSKAIELLEENVGTVTARSGIYITAAWGKEDQPDFYNQAVEIKTKLSPTDLIKTILKIEESLGRKRTNDKWNARTIDIDILFYNDQIIETPELKIPHPYIQERRFVLIPLNQIAGNYMHPSLNKSINTLLLECKDPLEVRSLNSN